MRESLSSSTILKRNANNNNKRHQQQLVDLENATWSVLSRVTLYLHFDRAIAAWSKLYSTLYSRDVVCLPAPIHLHLGIPRFVHHQTRVFLLDSAYSGSYSKHSLKRCGICGLSAMTSTIDHITIVDTNRKFS